MILRYIYPVNTSSKKMCKIKNKVQTHEFCVN